MSQMTSQQDSDNRVGRSPRLLHLGKGKFRELDPRDEPAQSARSDQDHEDKRRRLNRCTLQGLVRRPQTEGELRETIEQAFAYRGDVSLLLDDDSVVTGYVFDRRAREALNDCKLRLIPTRWKADPHERIVIAYTRVKAVMFSGRDAAGGLAWEVWREKKSLGESQADQGHTQ